MDLEKRYDHLRGLPPDDLADLAGALLPPEVRAHLPSRATPEEIARALCDHAEQAPAVARSLDRRLGDPAADWLRWGARKYGSVRVVGFQDQYKIRLSLHDVFVALSVQPRGRGEAPRDHEGGAHGGWHAEEPRRANLAEALAYAGRLADTSGIVLLGDPGAGKTTLLHHLYTRVALAGSETMGLPEGLFPVFIRCSSIRDDDRKPNGLKTVLLRQAESDGYAAAGKRIIDEGRPVLFLLDGLDEVRARKTRAQVCDWLGDEVTHWHDSRFAVTCRSAAFRDEARLDTQFVRVELEWLDTPRVREFVHRWFRAVHEKLPEGEATGDHAAEQAEALLQVVLEPARMQSLRLREMTQNPLLLSTLCLLYRCNLKLPEKRGELYDRSISLLLETWAEHGKRPSLPDRPSRLVLQPLAHAMHTRAVKKEIEVEEAERLIAAPLARVRDLRMPPAEFLRVACEQCGVLASRNIGSYEFFHLSFQEYLCAAHMKENGLVADLARCAADPEWNEVVLLAMSMQGMFAPFVRALIGDGRVATSVPLLRACMDETIELDPAPFLELFDAALAQMARPRRGLRALVARWFEEPAPNLAPELRAALELVRGRDLPGVLERAAGLKDHPDLGVAAAARALVEGPAVEQVAEPAVAGAGWREPVTGMSLVWVPPGRFLMGSSKVEGEPGFDAEAYDGETPAHRVELSHGVWMGEHPVTNAQYGVFLAETKSAEPAYWQNRRFNGAEQPVVGVSFEDALAFCEWLTKRAGLRDGHVFELPTEAEWEYAARGSDGRKYPWGKESPTAERACFSDPSLNVDANETALVGGRPAGKSPFGCQDMAGNVWEWCLDAWQAGYGHMMTKSVNPCHPGDLRGSPRVVRGGSWGSGARYLRCADRVRSDPGTWDWNLGFRVVCRGSRQPWLLGS